MLRLFRRFQADREDHEVEVGARRVSLFVDVLDAKIVRAFDLLHRRRAAADEPDAELLGPLVVGVESLAERAEVHEEDAALQPGLVLHRDDRLFGGVHAADGRAVVMVLVARTDALKKSDLLGVLSVRRPEDLPLVRTTCGEDSLKLEAGHDVWIPGVTHLELLGGVVQTESRG